MTTQDDVSGKSHSVVERLTHAFGDWLKHRQELNEMRQLNTAEFDRIAGDLRVSPPTWTNWCATGRMLRMNCRDC